MSSPKDTCLISLRYIVSNNSKMTLRYDIETNTLTRLADKSSIIGFHKAVLIERRNKPFIYMIGGYDPTYGYCITEKYHVEKNKWKKMKAKTCTSSDSHKKTGNTLVNLSLYYFSEDDTLYAFGGEKLQTTVVVSFNIS